MEAHLGQVSEEFPKFDDNKKDKKGRHGSSHLQGGDQQRVKASPGWEHPGRTARMPRWTRTHTRMLTPEAYLRVAPRALLDQAPRHGAAHGEALEEASDEVAEAEGHQLLWGGVA